MVMPNILIMKMFQTNSKHAHSFEGTDKWFEWLMKA